MSTPSGSASLRCASCNHVNLAGAKFCAQCGAPCAVAVAGSVAATAAPVPDGDALVAAVERIGGQVAQRISTTQLTYRARYGGAGSNFAGSKFAVPMYFAGTLKLDGADGAASATSSIEPKSLAIQLGLLSVAVVIMLLLPQSIVDNATAMFVVVVGAAVTLWMCLVHFPRKMRETLLASLATAKPQPQIGADRPPAPPAPAPSPTTPQSSMASRGDPLTDGLQRLAELKKLGALTDEEFTAKKAELLARF